MPKDTQNFARARDRGANFTSIRFYEDYYDLKEIAKARNIPFSEVIREAVAEISVTGGSNMRLKKDGCTHQWESEPECQPAYLNNYDCPCGAQWDDIWSCGCDDECPQCGADVSPSESEEIAPCACAYLRE